jgi:hypothetical protein
MSYDLFFHRDTAQPAITQNEFLKYFQSRPHYQVKNSQAWYENEDTGVYFSFEYEDEDKGDPEPAPSGRASFNMNYNRPHIFGLEAEPEVSAFVESFNFLVDDPQDEGMGQGSYTPRGFLQGWNAGNRFACQAILTMEKGTKVDVLPGSLIESSWRWNLHRKRLEDKLEKDLVVGFVPRIMFIRYQGKIVRTVVWTDTVVTVLPPVDVVLVNRTKSGKQNDFALITWQDVLPHLETFKKVAETPRILFAAI